MLRDSNGQSEGLCEDEKTIDFSAAASRGFDDYTSEYTHCDMQCCGSARCGPTIDQPQEPARGCRPEDSSACKFLNRSKPHGKTKRKDSNFVIERRAHLGPSASESVHSTGARVELGTKKELPTQRLAARKLDEILSRINDYAYQPTRISTIAEFAKR